MNLTDPVFERLHSLQVHVDQLLEDKKVLEQKLSKSDNEKAILQQIQLSEQRQQQRQFLDSPHGYHHHWQLVSE